MNLASIFGANIPRINIILLKACTLHRCTYLKYKSVTMQMMRQMIDMMQPMIVMILLACSACGEEGSEL